MKERTYTRSEVRGILYTEVGRALGDRNDHRVKKGAHDTYTCIECRCHAAQLAKLRTLIIRFGGRPRVW